MPQAYPKRKEKGEQIDPHHPFPWCNVYSISQSDPACLPFPARSAHPHSLSSSSQETSLYLASAVHGGVVVGNLPTGKRRQILWPPNVQSRRLHDCLTWNARYQGCGKGRLKPEFRSISPLLCLNTYLAYAECFFPAPMSPCAHPFVLRRFMLYLSSDPNILDSKNMWCKVLYIILRYSCLISLISLFFPRLSCSCMFNWHWKVWRYWLHIFFWHTIKYAICCLHTLHGRFLV